MTLRQVLKQDKDAVLTAEEKKLLDESTLNERAHKTISGKQLRKKLATCTK